jgi:hypothetical protein
MLEQQAEICCEEQSVQFTVSARCIVAAVDTVDWRRAALMSPRYSRLAAIF